MLNKLVYGMVYVRVFKDQLRVRHVGNGKEVTISATEPFTTNRLLVGNFASAEHCLREGIDKVQDRRWFSVSRPWLFIP